jgi:hypothetical protein
MPSMIYCPVPSDVWATVKTPMLRSLRLGLSDPTGQWGHVSDIVLDRDYSVLLPQSGHSSVMSHRADVADSTRLALPFSRGVHLRATCRLAGLLDGQVGRQSRLAGLLGGSCWVARRSSPRWVAWRVFVR